MDQCQCGHYSEDHEGIRGTGPCLSEYHGERCGCIAFEAIEPDED